MKSIFKINIILLGIALIAGCSDWTKPESIEIEKNSIEISNPELYAKYCAALREYKTTDHKVVYTTYDNVPTEAANGSEKLTMLPDSIDFVQMMNLEISETHQAEMKQLKETFGTRFVVRFSVKDCKAAYDAYVESLESEAEDAAPAVPTFAEYFAAEFEKVTDAVALYGLDGFTFAFTGKNHDGMTAEQQAAYAAEQAADFAPLKAWIAANSSKVLFLEGNPQYILDSQVINAASYYILPTRECRSVGELGLFGLNAFTSGKLPENAKLIYSVETPSFIEEEYLVGQFVLGEQIPLASDWLAKDASFPKSGVAIWNVQRDYFNTSGVVYPNVRKAIKTMNPNE